jgi:pimeloyl-ACP methyl ester carboxylesterase
MITVAAMSDSTVVLVHGAWHGAWCWEPVVALLADRGIRAVGVELPLTSFADDVQVLRDVLDDVSGYGSVVLCGHSYGGAVITQAGAHPAVDQLVYICAVAPAEGEKTVPAAELADADAGPTPLLIVDDGSASFDPQLAVEMFYGGCDADDVAWALARLRPIMLACFGAEVTEAAWRVRHSTYVITRDDKALSPTLQRSFAARCNDVVEWPTSHSPFLSQPELVSGLLGDIAANAS